MADFKSDLVEELESGKQNSNLRQQRGSGTQFMQHVVIPSGMVADDRIELFKLKAGEVIGPGSYIAWDALGTSTTVDIGTDADEDRYRGPQSTASAGQTELASNTAFRSVLDKDTTGETTIWMKVEGAAPTAGADVVFFWNLYHSVIL